MSQSNIIIYSIFSIFFASFFGFFLGRYSAYNEKSNRTQILIEDIPIDKNFLNAADAVFASKAGNRYYPVFCNGHENISEKNKIKFESAEIAEKNGYAIAKSCA